MRGRQLLATTLALVLAAGSLVAGLAVSAGASAPQLQPTIRPPEGQTAVKNGDEVAFDGSVTPGSQIQEAFLRFVTPQGEKARNDIDVTGRLSIQSGRLTGTRVIPSLAAEADDGSLALHVRAANPQTGEESSAVSPSVVIDLVQPVITGTFLTAPRRVMVQFSEPVHTPGIFEAGDWRIDDTPLPPHAVREPEGRPDRRVLDLSLIDESKDEDATPHAWYRAELVIGRAYKDRAGHTLGLPREFISRDLIPPVVPTITHVADQAGTDVLSNDPTPTIRVQGLRTTGDGAPRNHRVRVYVETGKQDGFQADGPNADALIGTAEADASGAATIDTEGTLGEDGLGSDGDYTLYAVAADRALCTPPDGSEECPNLSDPAAATYRLDTVAPAPVMAAITEEAAQTIDVQFTEPILPGGGSALEWTVTAGGAPILVEGVSGSGADRTLALSAPVPPGTTAQVSWTPGEYADAAGNQMEGFQIEALDMVPPVVTLTDPLGKVWTSGSSATIRGQAPRADVVDISQDAGAAGTLSGDAPVATGGVDGNGRFAITVGLAGDGAYDFRARGRRIDPDVEGQAVSVPTITRDTVAPQVAVLSPDGDSIFRGGQQTTIRWNATDPNFGAGPINIEFRPSGGASWQSIAGSEANDGEFDWTVPTINSANARIRITATDRAGNAAAAVTQPFEIDSIAPRFDATTVDTDTVRVRFTEPVTGASDPAQWLISRTGAIADRKPVGAVVGGAGTITELTLRTLPENSFGRNSTPEVIYTPMPHGQVYRDRAGNLVPLEQEPPPEGLPGFPHFRTVADDGIVPELLGVDPVPAFTRNRTVAITGKAEADNNEALARRRSPRTATFSSTVDHSDETFRVPVGLVANRRNIFDVEVRDPSGNTSETKRVRITHDNRKPRVNVRTPRGKRVRTNRRVWIRWRSVEANRNYVRIQYQFRTRRGKVVTRVIRNKAPDNGRYRWKVPRNLRGLRIRFRVVAVDRVNLKGVGASRWMRGVRP